MSKDSFLGMPKERISEHAFPVLLASAVGFASIYTFHRPSAYVLGVLYLVCTGFLFRLFDRLRSIKAGALLYGGMLLAAGFASYMLVRLHASLYGRLSPLRWFYAQNDDDVFAPLLLGAIFIGGGFFLASVTYYFTIIRYRTMGALLCTMFPYVLFSKRFEIMPDAMTTLIVLLFLGVVIHSRRIYQTKTSGGQAKMQVDRAYIINITAFVLIVGAVTFALDKPYHQAFLEKNTTLFNPFTLDAGRGGGHADLSDQSSPRSGQTSFNYRPLFYFESGSGAEEIFLRKQAFDYFNGEVWEPAFDGVKPARPYYCLEREEYGADDIAADMGLLTGRDTSSFNTLQFAHVFDGDFRPKYLPAPNGAVTDDRPYRDLVYYKDLWNSSIYRKLRTAVIDDDFFYWEPQSELLHFAKELGFDADEYLAFLSGAQQTDREASRRLAGDYQRAMEYFTDRSNISERLIALSAQIVAGCHSDYEKAEALERYFEENDFVYSLEYLPPDNSIDYFVFESKTGYCANFATAMTLMARAAGLPARYVEGYAAFEKNEEGSFVIRDAYAHAVVEVYIPGAGWLTFNPTVSGYNTIVDEAGMSLLARIADIAAMFNKLSVVIAAAAVLLFFVLLERLREAWLHLSLAFRPLPERVIALYANLMKMAESSLGRDLSSYTPDMLRGILVRERGDAPQALIALFEKIAFGGFACSKSEYRAAYAQYRRCSRTIRRGAAKKQ